MRDVEMRYLARGMYARVGAPGGVQRDRLAHDRRECLTQHPGDRALVDLSGPSREIGSVIGNIEP